MTQLEQTIQSLTPPDFSAGKLAARRWNSLAKPLGGLGTLEDHITRMAALTGSPEVRLDRRKLLVICADNGVTAQGVSQCGSEVTASVARALAAGTSTVCHMAKTANCEVVPVDLGIQDFEPTPGVLNRRIRSGTADISQGPAMGREECEAAILTGIQLVQDLRHQGVDILAMGEMGIGNTTTSSAVASVLLRQPPEALTGRGAGLSTEGLERKIQVIKTAIRCNHPNPADPVDVLSKVGGLDLACLCGICLGGLQYRVPILLDGFICSVAALCGVRLCPDVKTVLFASHVSSEPAGKLLLDTLGLRPLIAADMHLGEGTGAVAALPLLDMALAVYHSGNTFSHLGIDAYQPLK